MSHMHSSGNLLADRRYAYGLAAFKEHDFGAAVDLFEQTRELVPDFIPATISLARAKIAQNPNLSAQERDSITSLLQEAIIKDPSDQYGAGLLLAQLGLKTNQALSPAFIAELFDQYAPRFEHHLTHDLQYCGPDLLLKALKAACVVRNTPLFFEHVIDVGCGTGLMGAVLQPFVRTLVGCDLSQKMIAKALEKQRYKHLEVCEMHAYLSRFPPQSIDLIIAADVFVYLGETAPFFELCQAIIKRSGLIAFTVQLALGSHPQPYQLGTDQRYAHTRTYIESTLAQHGFEIIVCNEDAKRFDRGLPVKSLTIVAAHTDSTQL